MSPLRRIAGRLAIRPIVLSGRGGVINSEPLHDWHKALANFRRWRSIKGATVTRINVGKACNLQGLDYQGVVVYPTFYEAEFFKFPNFILDSFGSGEIAAALCVVDLIACSYQEQR